jgi:hypothetical protein
MMTDAAYTLLLAGRWDLAMAATDDPNAHAEILVNKANWRIRGQAEATAAVEAMPDRTTAAYLAGQLAYFRLVFGEEAREVYQIDLTPLPDDQETALRGFHTAANDDRLSGWGQFWLGVYAENFDDDLETAAKYYETAALTTGDPLLESHVVRHQGVHLRETDPGAAQALFRRSFLLRVAIGARAYAAAAAIPLANSLPPGAEADELRSMAMIAAEDLDLTWVRQDLAS